MKPKSITKKQIQECLRLVLDDCEYLLHECSISLSEQIDLFGSRLSERAQPISFDEFQLIISWLKKQNRIDAGCAAWAENSFYRIAQSDRAAANELLA